MNGPDLDVTWPSLLAESRASLRLAAGRLQVVSQSRGFVRQEREAIEAAARDLLEAVEAWRWWEWLAAKRTSSEKPRQTCTSVAGTLTPPSRASLAIPCCGRMAAWSGAGGTSSSGSLTIERSSWWLADFGW